MQIPRPVIPGDVPVDVRVRVIAPDLPPGWHPGHLVLSSEGCRVVTVATAPEEHPVVILNMGQISRLQLSQAEPPPEWWAEPEESEGWTEFDTVQPAARERSLSQALSRRGPSVSDAGTSG